MHRFIVSARLYTGALVRLSDAEAHHALRVLRLQPGAKVQLSDGEGALYDAELITVDGEAWVSAAAPASESEPPVALTIYQGLPKFDKLELICQKATELGAIRIVPVKTARSVVKLDAKEGDKRRERMARIAAESAKQSGRALVPEVLAPVTFSEALELMAGEQLMIMPWERARATRLSDVCALKPTARAIGLFIGPEGGIDEREADKAQAAGAYIVTLGPRIMRTETAAIASAAIIMQLWGDI